MKNFLYFLILSVCLNTPVCSAAQNNGGSFMVRYVADGDTLVLENGEKVRLIGVDTPEIHDDDHRNQAHARKYGQNPRTVDEFAFRARKFVREAVLRRRVRLEYDWQTRDKFGRLLAYVYREPDDFFLNAELVKQGYGFVYTRFPFKYENQFRAYQAQARHERQGLWG